MHNLEPTSSQITYYYMNVPNKLRVDNSICLACHETSAGADTTRVKLKDAGILLSETLKEYMSQMNIENGLKAIGFTTEDIPALVKGTLPQVYTFQLHVHAGYRSCLRP